ncbi:alpha/beta fold hydrolase [Paenibacillus filicis]|uniref:Alpha/beta fold hydrolase n=1 Tax=Paenibacillus gyeongsangnamensis TaxID=3388067 RepID=A0ABT4Q9K0_9BACL|nr:alpha/beta fold hydrolase [Paenibacillus filicis]MCZ8513552.1 alpha/beta fold hydrolase [Paenibacillus filicis]
MEQIRHAAFELELGEGLRLRGDVKLAENGSESRPVVLFVHGFKSFKDWGFYPYVTDVFAAKGYYTVSFSFSCSGVNETDFDELEKFAVGTYSREQQDLAALLEALKRGELPGSESADLGRIALVGHSRGGGNSLIFAGEHSEIGAVVTWNGIADVDLFDDAFKAEIARSGVAYVPNMRTKQQMPIRAVFYEDLARNKERFELKRIMKELRTPVLALMAGQDSVRLRRGFEELQKAAPHQRYEIIPDTGHTFGAVHPFAGTTPQLEEAVRLSLEFIGEQLG